MIPFYLGKLFRQTGASDDICAKVGFSYLFFVLANLLEAFGNSACMYGYGGHDAI